MVRGGLELQTHTSRNSMSLNRHKKTKYSSCEARIAEQHTGEYDVFNMFKKTLNHTYLDYADYVGPVELCDILGNDMGVIASCDIAPGTLLMASKAISSVYRGSNTAESVKSCVDVIIDGIMTTFDSPGYNLCTQVMECIRKDSHLADKIYKLHSGIHDRSIQCTTPMRMSMNV